MFLIGTMIILASNDVRLLLPLGLWFAAFLGIAWWFVPRITKVGQEVAEARSRLAGRIVDSYTNIQTVKLFAHAEREEEYARDAMEDFRWTFARQTRLYTTLTILMTGLSVLLIGGVIGYSVWLWSLDAVSIGVVAAAAALVLRMNGMVDWIMWDALHAVSEHWHSDGGDGDSFPTAAHHRRGERAGPEGGASWGAVRECQPPLRP